MAQKSYYDSCLQEAKELLAEEIVPSNEVRPNGQPKNNQQKTEDAKAVQKDRIVVDSVKGLMSFVHEGQKITLRRVRSDNRTLTLGLVAGELPEDSTVFEMLTKYIEGLATSTQKVQGSYR